MIKRDSISCMKENRVKFLNRIICDEIIKKLHLLKLQKEFEENKISEEDLSDEQALELKELYKTQINRLKEKFEINRKKAINLRKELKQTHKTLLK